MLKIIFLTQSAKARKVKYKLAYGIIEYLMHPKRGKWVQKILIVPGNKFGWGVAKLTPGDSSLILLQISLVNLTALEEQAA